MIKIEKGNVNIEGDFIDIMNEMVIGLKDLVSIAEDYGIDKSEVLGGIIAGIYKIRDKEGNVKCYNLGKFIDYKCKEMKK